MPAQPDADRQPDRGHMGDEASSSRYGYAEQGRGEQPVYGYGTQHSHYKAPQPGKKKTSLGVIGIIIQVIGWCLFALPFLHNFGILSGLGIGPAALGSGFMSLGFGLFGLAFVGFGLIVVGRWVHNRSK